MKSLVNKYRPDSLSDVVGHPTAVKNLKKWAKNFEQGDDPHLLYGPPGTGKTSCVEALANDFGWNLVEINASSARTTENLFSVAQQIRSEAIGGRHQLILLDEVDSYSGSVSLKPLLDALEDAPNPVIATANSKYDVPDSIENRCETHKFSLQKKSIKNHLEGIANEEGIEITSRELGKLSTRDGMRDAIQDLQRFAYTDESVDWDDRETEVGEFGAVGNVLKGKQFTGDVTPPDLVNWLDANLPGEYRGVELMRAYQAISEADKWVQRTNRTQNYTWWRYAGSLAEEVASVRLTEPYNNWVNVNFPKKFYQSKTEPYYDKPVSKLYRELKETEKMNFRASFSFSEFQNAVLPILREQSDETKYQLCLTHSLSEDAMSALGITRSEYDEWSTTEEDKSFEKDEEKASDNESEDEKRGIMDF